MNNNAGVLILGFVVLMFIFGPLAIVWSINTLFGLAIPYTFKTWIAMLLLSMATGGTKLHFTSKK